MVQYGWLPRKIATVPSFGLAFGDDGTSRSSSLSPLHQKQKKSLPFGKHAPEHSHLIQTASWRHRNLIPILFDPSLESSDKNQFANCQVIVGQGTSLICHLLFLLGFGFDLGFWVLGFVVLYFYIFRKSLLLNLCFSGVDFVTIIASNSWQSSCFSLLNIGITNMSPIPTLYWPSESSSGPRLN